MLWSGAGFGSMFATLPGVGPKASGGGTQGSAPIGSPVSSGPTAPPPDPTREKQLILPATCKVALCVGPFLLLGLSDFFFLGWAVGVIDENEGS